MCDRALCGLSCPNQRRGRKPCQPSECRIRKRTWNQAEALFEAGTTKESASVTVSESNLSEKLQDLGRKFGEPALAQGVLATCEMVFPEMVVPSNMYKDATAQGMLVALHRLSDTADRAVGHSNCRYPQLYGRIPLALSELCGTTNAP